MADDAGTVQEKDQWIYLPEPEGYRRALIVTEMGQAFACDCQLEELVVKVREFLEGREQLLELVDAGTGLPVYFPRRSVERFAAMRNEWIKKPAPQGAKDGKIAVVKDLPVALTRQQRRRGGR